MKTLICPISPKKVNRYVTRLTEMMMVSMIVLYLFTGNITFILAIVIDYFIRAFTDQPYSPFSFLAALIVRLLDLAPNQIHKAPRLFAARVSWLFALATAVLYFVYPPASIVTGAVLISFALLESVFDFCISCLVYTNVVFPLMGESLGQHV